MGAFWGAFLTPIFTVMVFNVAIFIWIIVVLIQHSRRTATRKGESMNKKTVVRLMVSIIGVMFLFGLTWFFAILTFSVPGLRDVGSVLFTISNSLQGFFIFIFFCVINKEARESWKEFLSCGKYKSQFLHPSLVNYNLSGRMTDTLKTSTMKPNTPSSPGVDMYSPTNLKTFDYDTCMLIKNKNVADQATIDQKVVDTASSLNATYFEVRFLEPNKIATSTKRMNLSPHGSSHQNQITENKRIENRHRSLHIRVSRKPSKKQGKHDIEVMEVDFYSNSSSDDEDDDL